MPTDSANPEKTMTTSTTPNNEVAVSLSAPVDVLAVIGRKRAAFRNKDMRAVYEANVAAYKAKGAEFMAEGNSGAVMFRRGFTGNHVGNWDAASCNTYAYAQFRVGQDCAIDEARAAVAELIEAAEKVADCIADFCDEEGSKTDSAGVRLRAALARVGGAA